MPRSSIYDSESHSKAKKKKKKKNKVNERKRFIMNTWKDHLELEINRYYDHFSQVLLKSTRSQTLLSLKHVQINAAKLSEIMSQDLSSI